MNALKRHLSIILSIFIIFTMCPSTLYASPIDTDDASTEITAPEPDTAQGEAILDESESITEEIIDEAVDETVDGTVDGIVDETGEEAAPVIEEALPETADSPDTDEYAEEPATEAEAQDSTPETDTLPESEELVGKQVTIFNNLAADFNPSTGALVFFSNNNRNSTLPSDWLYKSGIERAAIKSIDFNTRYGSYTFYLPENCSRLFADLPNLTSINFSALDTSNVTDMSYIFLGCSSLTEIDLFCDFSNVTKASGMLDGCKKLRFLRTPNNNSVSVKLPVTLYRYSGIACTELPKSSQSVYLTRSKTLSKGSMLVGNRVTASFNASTGTLSFYSENGTLWPGFLYYTNLDKNSIKTINTAFGTVYFPEDSGSLFYGCENLKTLDLSHFGKSKVTKVRGMFNRCYSLESLDLSCLDTTGVDDMGELFKGCRSLTDLNISSFDTSNVTGMYKMFAGCNSLKSMNLSHFDTSNVTNMYFMFMNCYSLTSLDLSNFKTPKLERMQYMFSECNSLTILDMSGLDLSNVPELFDFDSTLLPFAGCTNLRILKTPKKNPIARELPFTMYDRAGKSYSKLPVTSQSIMLFRPKQLATDYRKYGKLFTDVLDPTHPYYNAIYWAAQKGITKGYSDGSFGIDLPCTRGHAVMFLWRMAGCPKPTTVSKSPFLDVPTNHVFYKAVLWAQQKGITTGYTSGSRKGKFSINETCTRGQIMTFIWRYKGKPKPKLVSRTPFSDVPKNHPYYQAILWGSQNGVTNGYTTGQYKGTFGIDRACTRGQIVTFLYRIR